MFSYTVLVCTLAVASAQYFPYPGITTSQYHAQDELGQYSYGYAGGPSSKQEVRTADGITRGSYSYIDGNGLVQSASYVADPLNGFRVAATNLPVGPAPAVPVVAAPAIPIAAPAAPVIAPAETPEVIAAKAAHFAAHHEAIARLGRKKRSVAVAAVPAVVPAKSFAYSTVAAAPIAAPLAYSAPIAAGVAAPLAYSAPIAAGVAAPLAYSAPLATPLAYSTPFAYSAPIAAPVVSKYQAQDELGQYSYGYNDGLSAKQEARAFDGTTTGGYSYVDANGIVQSVKYVADAAGFRVAATNLPVGPVA